MMLDRNLKAAFFVALEVVNFDMPASALPGDLIFLKRRGEASPGGKPYENDAISIEFNNLALAVDALLELDRVFGNRVVRKEVHASYGFEGQCNIEFTVEEVALIARTEAVFTITCYEYSES